MSLIVNQFSIFREFPKELKQNIKLFHVFGHNIAYCVTNDDQVYGFGDHCIRYFDSEESDNNNYVLIQELCDKNIEQFFSDNDFPEVFFARCEANEIYSWVWNYYGQLGKGFIDNAYNKPEKHEFFSDKNIIQISLFFQRYLALSTCGQVYGWGDNGSETYDWESKEKINSWIGKYPEKLLSTCFLIVNSIVKQKTNKSLYERRDENWIKIDYKNPFEYNFIRYQKTYKTIHLKNNEKYSIDYCLSEESNELKKRLEIIYFNESKLTIS